MATKRPGRRQPVKKAPEQASARVGKIGLEDPVLQSIQDSSSRAFARGLEIPNYTRGIPTDIQSGDYNANINEAVRVDPSNGALTIYLPKIDKSMVGGAIFVINISAEDTNEMTVLPAGNDTIDGQSNFILAGPYNTMGFFVADDGLWTAGRNIRIPGNITIGGNFFAGGGAIVTSLLCGASAFIGDMSVTGDMTVTGDISGSGWGAQTYTTSNVNTDRAYDADATTVDELADVLGTLIADLKTLGLIS